MIRYIHRSWSLDKQLEGLRKAGKKAELAADKCESIISAIRENGCNWATVLSQRTRNGELRIKNCVKYDLGCGYRLVTIKVDCHLLLTFVGSHDDTDQWIEHHRCDTFVPRKLLYHCEEMVASPGVAEPSPVEPQMGDDIGDEYEDQLSARLDESHLKSIFQGLFMHPSGASKRTDDVRTAKDWSDSANRPSGIH